MSHVYTLHKQLRSSINAMPVRYTRKFLLYSCSKPTHLECRTPATRPALFKSAKPILSGALSASDGSHGSHTTCCRNRSHGSSVVPAAAVAAAALVAATAGSTSTYLTDHQQNSSGQEHLKMVLCVNQSLKMGKGKIGAQCAHAAIGVVLQLLATDVGLYMRWEQCGQRKIVVKVNDAQSMDTLAATAAAAELPCYTVKDAGRTQVAPGSQTVLAIGPGPEADIDRLTRHLSLL